MNQLVCPKPGPGRQPLLSRRCNSLCASFLSKVTQEVHTATINEEIKRARMKVGVYVSGNAIRAAGKQTGRVLVDLDKREVEMYRNNFKIVQPNAGVVAPDEDAEPESDLGEEDGDEILGLVAPDVGPLQDAENNKIVAHGVTWTFGDDVAVDITEEDDRQHQVPAKILKFNFRGGAHVPIFFGTFFLVRLKLKLRKRTST